MLWVHELAVRFSDIELTANAVCTEQD